MEEKHHPLSLNCRCQKCVKRRMKHSDRSAKSDSPDPDNPLEPVSAASSLEAVGKQSMKTKKRPTSDSSDDNESTAGRRQPARQYKSKIFYNSNRKRAPIESEDTSTLKNTNNNVAVDDPQAGATAKQPDIINKGKRKRTKPATTTTRFKRQKGIRPENQQSQDCFTSVKMKLATALQENTNAIGQIISHMSIKATRIASLASLLLLAKINDNIDDREFFDCDAKDVVEDCFFEVLNPIKGKSGRRRQQKLPQYMSQRFEQLLSTHRIIRPNNDDMGNMFKYLQQMYHTNFETNICTHGWKRILNFFKTVAGSTKKQRRDTMGYLFDESSTCDRDESLITALNNLPHHTIRSWRRGALQNFDRNWFAHLPLFLAIQRNNYRFNMEHAEEWRQEDEQAKSDRKMGKIKRKYPRIRPMNIVPIVKFRRQHIRIDTEGLFRIYSVLKQLPKQPDKPGRNITFVQFKGRQHEFWSRFFDMEKIENICSRTKYKNHFSYQIQTDGVSVSLLYDAVPKRPVQVDEKINRIRNSYRNKHYRYETSIDVGFNTYSAAIRRSIDTGKEVNTTLKAKRFHRSTKNNLRKKKFHRLASEFEFDAANDRENRQLYNETPTPTGAANYCNYVEHSIRFWQRAIGIYTTPEYAAMAFDKYTNTQKQIDGIVNRLTNGGKPTLFLIGGAEFSSYSPIKGHVRCPSIRKVTRALARYKETDCLFVDEYCTSQHCGLCLGKFAKSTKAFRFKTCRQCGGQDTLTIPKAPSIVTRESKRNMQKQRLEQRSSDTQVRLCRSRRFNFDGSSRTERTTWHRDVCACRLIMYKGLNALMGRPIDQRLMRRSNNEDDSDGDDDEDNNASNVPIIW